MSVDSCGGLIMITTALQPRIRMPLMKPRHMSSPAVTYIAVKKAMQITSSYPPYFMVAKVV